MNVFGRAAGWRVRPDGDAYAYMLAFASRSEDYRLLRMVRRSTPLATKRDEVGSGCVSQGHCPSARVFNAQTQSLA
jgi:hypothetical protein